DASAHLRERQSRLDPMRGFDKRNCVVVVFFDSRGDSENVGIEDDVVRRKSNFLRQYPICTRADFDLSLDGVGLSSFIESHDDDGRAIPSNYSGMSCERLYAFLET